MASRRFRIEFTVDMDCWDANDIEAFAIQELTSMSPYPRDIEFSEVGWHTGTPTRTDCLYLVLWFNTEDKVYQYSVLHWHDHLHYWFDEETPSCLWGDEWKAKVVAWMPFEPYKEAGE